MDEIMEANDFVEWFNIYPTAIKNVHDRIVRLLEKENIDFEWTFQEVIEKLEKNGEWLNITKSIVVAFCELAKEQFLKKYPNAKFYYNISEYTDGTVDAKFNWKL